MVVYPGGLCSGDTPQHEIKTTGAAGQPAKSENRTREESKGCPFFRDDDLPFPARSSSLSLDVLQPDDCPKGRFKFIKDYNMSLITEDLYRAKPLLAHPTTGNGCPVPWKLLEKPPLPEIPGSRAKSHYPPVNSSRPRDLALTTSDIDGCKARGTGGNCEGKHRLDNPVDPLNPSYKLSGSIAEDPPCAKASGRNSLDVTDIPGATAKAVVPFRNQYGDTLRVEDEFKSRKHATALADLRARAFGLVPRTGEDTMSPRGAACTPRLEGPRKSNRCSDPLDPRYRVPLAQASLGTSLCCTWAEEKRYLGETMFMESGDIGAIPGSWPDAHHNGRGDEPMFNLETRDVHGANPQRWIGGLPYSIYGPFGHRRDLNAILDTSDVKGAQADTLARYPKVSCLNSARTPPQSEPFLSTEGMPASARGRLLRSCPEKI